MSTLDYWRRTHRSKPRLVEVRVERSPATGFALVLANGRRIVNRLRLKQTRPRKW